MQPIHELLAAVVDHEGHPRYLGELTQRIGEFDSPVPSGLAGSYVELCRACSASLVGRSKEAREAVSAVRSTFASLNLIDPLTTVDLVRGIALVEEGELGRAIVVLGETIATYGPHVEDGYRRCQLAELLLYYGLAHRRLGFRDIALETYLRGLRVAADLDLPDAHLLSSMFHNNIAVILRLEGDHVASVQHLERGIEVSLDQELPSSQVAQRLNLVRGLRTLGREEDAERWLAEAETLADCDRLHADVREAHARIAIDEGRLQEAVDLMATVLVVRRTVNKPHAMLSTLQLYGSALRKLGDPGAGALLAEGFELAERLGELEQEETLTEELVSFHRGQGHVEQALDWSTRLVEVVRRRADEQRSFQLQQLRARHELDEHAHRAELLKVRTVELERAVQERTEKLVEQNRELSEARDAARAASVAKSRFLAVTSHELRTPLNAVLGYTEMLQEEHAGGDLEPEELTDALGRVHGAARHLLGLIQRILTLSSLEGGMEQPVPAPFDAVDLLREALAEVEPRASHRGHRLELLPSGALPVHTDAERLRRITDQLLANAIDHNDPTTVQVHARRLGERLVVEVSNGGQAFDASRLEELFAPFTQADMTYTRERGGLGLGLTLARYEAELLGGRLLGEARQEGGLVLRVEVPAHLVLDQQSPVTARG